MTWSEWKNVNGCEVNLIATSSTAQTVMPRTITNLEIEKTYLITNLSNLSTTSINSGAEIIRNDLVSNTYSGTKYMRTIIFKATSTQITTNGEGCYTMYSLD